MNEVIYLAELTAKVWPTYLRSPTAAAAHLQGRTRVAVNPAKTYRVTAVARRSATANGAFFAGVSFFDSAGVNTGGPENEGSWFAAAWASPGVGWTSYTATFGAAGTYPFPAGAVYMAPVFILNLSGTLGEMDIRELWIEDTAAAGVAITQSRTFRDRREWRDFAALGSQYRTLIGSEVETIALRYATAGYMTQATDTPARTYYDGRIVQPGLVRTELPADFTGPISASYGELVLANADGALGELAYYGLDGQALTLKRGVQGAAYSSFTTVLQATMEQALVDRKHVRIRLRGPDARLQRPLLSTRYLGNNALPSGLEGSIDLAGRVKPRVYGAVYGISPPCVNTSRHIYQVSDSYIGASTTNVWDAGVPLTAGALYTSQADMEANAPSAGQYRAWPAGGMFRLGSAAVGVITCNASSIPSGHGNPWELWNVLWQIAFDAGVPSGDIAQAQSYTWPAPDDWADDWSTTQPNVGVWVDDLRTATDAMTEVARSLGVWFGFARTSITSLGGPVKFTAQPFPPPYNSYAGVGYTLSRLWFDESQILSVKALAAPGQGRGVPTWRVDLTFRHNYTPLSPSMAPTVAPATLGSLAVADRHVVASNSNVLGTHDTAVTLLRETRIVDDDVGAALEAQRQLAFRSVPLPWFEVTVPMDSVLASNRYPRPVLGGMTYLKWPELRVLWRDGVTRAEGWFTVHALELDFGAGEVRMTVRQAHQPDA